MKPLIHLNVENPCNMCKHYRPEYNIVHRKTYDRCNIVKSPYSELPTYCDIERMSVYDNISTCGSTGKCFSLASKKQRILNHITGFFEPVNITIVILLLTSVISFIILLS
jgi:hypothetical protein